MFGENPSNMAEWKKTADALLDQPQKGRDIAMTLNIFVKLGTLPNNIEKWKTVATKSLNKFQPKDIAMSLNAFAKFDTKPTDIEKWKTTVDTLLNKFNNKEAALIFSAFAKFNEKPTDIEKWKKVLNALLSQFSPKELEMIIQSFVKFNEKPSNIEKWEKAAASLSKGKHEKIITYLEALYNQGLNGREQKILNDTKEGINIYFKDLSNIALEGYEIDPFYDLNILG